MAIVKTRIVRSVLIVSLVFLSTGAGKCRTKPNIVLITADTLRADHLGCYGYPHAISPAIDSLAKKGTLFENAVTVIGKTSPAFVSMFTSRYPPETGARRNGIRMRPDMKTLTEVLKEQGYATGAVISNWTLQDHLCGLRKGFDVYESSFTRHRHGIMAKEKSASIVTQNAVELLNKLENEPFFLWIHYTDPHAPYLKHEKYLLPGFTDDTKPPGWQKRRDYASEIHYMDHWIGVFLQELYQHIDLADTHVFFFSDHGESLGEHGYWGHGQNVFQPNLHIPLIAAGPGWPENQRLPNPVSIIDLMPTILKTLDIRPPHALRGQPLQNCLNNENGIRRKRFAFADRGVVLLKHAPKKEYKDPLSMCIISGGKKVIYHFEKHEYSWYDLVSDPEELLPRTSLSEPNIRKMKTALSDWYSSLPHFEADPDRELSEEDILQLESLGYISR